MPVYHTVAFNSIPFKHHSCPSWSRPKSVCPVWGLAMAGLECWTLTALLQADCVESFAALTGAEHTLICISPVHFAPVESAVHLSLMVIIITIKLAQANSSYCPSLESHHQPYSSLIKEYKNNPCTRGLGLVKYQGLDVLWGQWSRSTCGSVRVHSAFFYYDDLEYA